jgi:hypothetical protein
VFRNSQSGGSRSTVVDNRGIKPLCRTRFKICRAPNGKFYVRGKGEAICLPNGSLRYFETERAAWGFLAECDAAEIRRIA